MLDLSPDAFEELRCLLGEFDGPVDVDLLVARLAEMWQAASPSITVYSPADRYCIGDRILYLGQRAEVIGIRRHRNPRQGAFSAIDLRFADGATRCVVGDVEVATGASYRASSGTSAGDASSPPTVADFEATHNSVVRHALLKDPRFADLVTDGGSKPVGVSVHGGRPSSSCNRGLFGDRVLAASLRAPASHVSAAPAPWLSQRAALQAILARGQDAGQAWDERDTWQQIIAPLLRRLGWRTLTLPEASCHVLRVASASSAVESSYQPSSGEAPVIVRSVPWACDLGAVSSPGSCAAATIELVGHLTTHEGGWGILTNGRQWRLYRSALGDPDVGCTAEETYEIDLGELVNATAPSDTPREAEGTALAHWWSLFGAEAFDESGLGPPVVGRLKRESADAAWWATRALRRQVQQVVLPEIAGGFVAFSLEHLSSKQATEEALAGILRGSVGLIARLLFVLRAEAVLDLPMYNPDYRGQSLHTLQRWALDQVRRKQPLSRSLSMTSRYGAVLALFRRLEHGDARLGLSGMHGGLFSPLDPDQGFLARHRLNDRVMARALAALGEVDGTVVDYTGLSVRHLSAVCEGLVESSLWVVEASAGQVALVSDRGVPQAVGSEPVPDHVGSSAVDRAVAQALDERAGDFESAMVRVVALRRAMRKADSSKANAEVVSISDGALREAEQAALDALLKVRVLDPAVRGGGLLLTALDGLVDGMMRILAAYHATHPRVPWEWNPVLNALRSLPNEMVRQASQPGSGNALTQSGIGSRLTRLVAQRCLYGVDLNPDVLTMARATLQMRAAVSGQPLLRLDHHLVAGNSLCGLQLRELSQAVAAFKSLRSDLVTVVEVAIARGDGDAALAATLQPYTTLASLWLSERFGNRGARELVRRRGGELLSVFRGEAGLEPDDADLVDRAVRIAQREGFLHWELAFPRVFLAAGCDDPERAGFDLVLSRPPSSAELGVAPDAASGLDYAAFFSSGRRGPFTQLAERLRRHPGGRVAMLIRPSEADRV